MAKLVKAGGENRPVLFGWGALMDFEERTGLGAFELLEKWGAGSLEGIKIKTLVELFYCGFLNGYEDAGKEVDFTIKNVANWLSEPGVQNNLTLLLTTQMPKGESEDSKGEAKAAIRSK